MNSVRSFIFAAILVLSPVLPVEARLFRRPSPEELLAKSELVVSATPVANHETTDRIAEFSGFHAEAIGVETQFSVSAVIKGDPKIKDLLFYHYWGPARSMPNGPMLVEFDPAKKEVYRLYLVRLADGRYAPTAGQMDAALSIKREKRR